MNVQCSGERCGLMDSFEFPHLPFWFADAHFADQFANIARTSRSHASMPTGNEIEPKSTSHRLPPRFPFHRPLEYVRLAEVKLYFDLKEVDSLRSLRLGDGDDTART
jgi:hypothetical protein